MSSIVFDKVDFHYSNPFCDVFTGVDLVIDTDWRTALVARNGRGKTTLLRLIAGEARSTRGHLEADLTALIFPFDPPSPEAATRSVIRAAVAPFDAWALRMTELSEDPSEEAMERYGEIASRFEEAGGYEIDSRIEREVAALGLDAEILGRPFTTLSGGEQTRALIAGLFLGPGAFPLIDEPTNHLDMAGRSLLADYLSRKNGFIVASHDRALLDACVDHVVAIERSGISVIHGNYSTWREQRDRTEAHEWRRRENLEREVSQLRKASGARRHGATKKEREKRGAADKGFIGHRAAKQMKRAIEIERRVECRLEEKEGLLPNWEKDRSLKLEARADGPTIVLTVNNLRLTLEDRALVDNLSFTLRRGDRIVLTGPNGCGKSTLLDAIAGESLAGPFSIGGTVSRPAHLRCCRSFQLPVWNHGSLAEVLERAGIDETRFRQMLGVLDVDREVFDHPLETLSQGQLKKVDLARSLMDPADLLIWDEPMNFIDVLSRERIEEAILAGEPTLLIVEHDRAFVDRVATEVIALG